MNILNIIRLAMSWISRSFFLAAIAIAVLVFAENAGQAQAENVQISQQTASDLFEQCLDTGDAKMAVMYAMIDCYDAELARKNVVLNRTYQDVRKKLDPAQRRHLVILERQWIAQRDQKCKAEAIEMGGQDGQITGYGCMIDETEKRIKWLEAEK